MIVTSSHALPSGGHMRNDRSAQGSLVLSQQKPHLNSDIFTGLQVDQNHICKIQCLGGNLLVEVIFLLFHTMEK